MRKPLWLHLLKRISQILMQVVVLLPRNPTRSRKVILSSPRYTKLYKGPEKYKIFYGENGPKLTNRCQTPLSAEREISTRYNDQERP